MSGHYIIMSFRQAIHTLELLDMQTRALITQISVRIIKKKKQNNSIYTAVWQFLKDLFETDHRFCTLLSSLNSRTFHDYFHDFFKFSMTLD